MNVQKEYGSQNTLKNTYTEADVRIFGVLKLMQTFTEIRHLNALSSLK